MLIQSSQSAPSCNTLTQPTLPAPGFGIKPNAGIAQVDAMDAAEAAWLAETCAPNALAKPRQSTRLRRVAEGVRPFVPALVGAAALGCLATQASAAFSPCAYFATATNPKTRFFSSADGSIQGEVIAPWDSESRGCAISASLLCDNFFDVLVNACKVVETSVRGMNGTGLRMPAYFEPHWFVHTNVNTYNVSDVLSSTVQCLFTQGNTLPPSN